MADPLEIRRLRHTDADFAHCWRIRLDVFVAEQNVPPAEERDADDALALHLLALRGGVPLGTARVLLQEGGTAAKISRVAVQKPARGSGIGAALLREVERAVPARTYLLDAQTHAIGFYQGLGYAAFGEEFTEAGMPHCRMRKAGRPA